MTSSGKRLSISIAIIAIAFIYMADSTWMTWPDAIYDVGTHLYNAWQIYSGKHLYTDIVYFNGPFSEYFNALMFTMFGVSLRTIFCVNAAIVIGMLLMIHRLMSRIGDVLPATFACVVFITLFAFSQYVGIGNYNWILPYTHEMTHGVALSLAMLIALAALFRTGHLRWTILSGGLLGLVFLTKAEISAPAAGAAFIGFILWGRFIGFHKLPKYLGLFCASFAIVILVAFTLLAISIGSSVAIRAIEGSWPWVFDRRIAQLEFYRQGLGIDDPAGNLWDMFVIGSATVAVVATVIAAGFRRIFFIIVCAELIAIAWFWQWTTQIARPWPVLVAIIAAISIRRAWKADHPDRLQWSIRSMLCIFAFGLMGKMLLNARIWQYGFALALPAAFVLIDAMLGWIPRDISQHGGSGKAMRWTGGFILACVIIAVHANQHVVHGVEEGTVGDQFIADSRGNEINRAVQTIDQLIPRNGTLAVMPQGLMLNYLARRADSISTINMMPPEMLSVGEEKIVAQLNAHPPDLIVLSGKDIRHNAFILTEGEYHYGKQIVGWVYTHYRCVVPANNNSELKFSFWIRATHL